jgi:heat shock protein HtpX
MRIAFNEVKNNKILSVVLMGFFIVLIGILGGAIGYFYDNIYIGLLMALFGGLAYTLIVYNSGGSMILAMSGAKPVTKQEYPHLYHAVEGLSIAAGIPPPKCYVIDDSALNAFATGKDAKSASITVTTGLMKKLNREELEGVIGHEMSHIKNYDIRFMMLVTVLIGIVTLLSDFLLRSFLWGGHGGKKDSGSVGMVLIVLGLVLAILSPIIGYMIRSAISRKREFAADAGGVVLTRYPPGLASALEKIKGDPDPLVDKANKATAHLFISTPFRKTGGISWLFSTHPPIDERIKRLKAM